MNKQDLIDAIAQAADISKSAAEVALNTFTDSVTETLVNGGKVAILGFGSFETSNRAARTGHNPQTGQKMQIPASTVAKFKAGKKLKDAVNHKD
ncbi:MAG: HU family DNA-binding protein [Gammaproteobacteria bacterium]|nr:HU family DNA-binding protein [Gammaproteobacteria bacterium]